MVENVQTEIGAHVTREHTENTEEKGKISGQ